LFKEKIKNLDKKKILFLKNLLGGNQHRSVLLEDVKTLTLQKGQRTEARRVSSIPQLKCVGGSAKGAYEPDVVQCYNRGSNGVDIQVNLFDFDELR